MKTPHKAFSSIMRIYHHIIQNNFRITDDGDNRITDDGNTRITDDSDF
jgi:hypothetical protein